MRQASALALGLGATWVTFAALATLLERRPDVIRAFFFATSAANSILIYAWCKAYARDRALQPPAGISLLVAVLSPLVVPAYFFVLLPWRRALAATGRAALFVAGCIAVSVATSEAISLIRSSN